MDATEDWSVPNSDDERDEELISLKTIANGGSCCVQDLPVKILKYYEEIDKKTVLELSVQEFRVSCPRDDVDEDNGCHNKEHDGESKSDDDNNRTGTSDREHDTDLEKSNKPSAFDYLDEPEECQGQIPRRTSKAGRLPKKRVGTLKNVISDLKRYRELDSSSSDDHKAVSTDERDVEGNKDFSEPKDDAAEKENT